MSMKNLFVGLVGLCAVSLSAHAGSEDWNADFTVNFGGRTYNAAHSPERVQLLFMSAGKCIHLGKGMVLNGTQIKEDIDVCVSTNIPDFKKELSKLGAITSEKIVPGSTYHD